jgi:succinyl-diaminopimelate desuccinylase
MSRLDEMIVERFPDILQSVRESVNIPSVLSEPTPGAPFGAAVGKALEHALETAASLGLRTANIDGYAGYAEWGEGAEMVAVLGHLDVVPAGEGWARSPFDAQVDGNRLYGRGVMDDKGPVIGALWLLHFISRLDLPLRRRVRVILGTNEESGSKDIPYYIGHAESPLMAFTPDGDFPVVNAEKGQLHVRLSGALDAGDAVRLTSMRGGTVINVVPGEAFAKLACADEMSAEALACRLGELARERGYDIVLARDGRELSLVAKGLQAHGSLPELGINAVARLAELLVAALPKEGWARALGASLGPFFGDTEGRKLGVTAQDAVSGKLSCNLGLFESDGNGFAMSLDFRSPVTLDVEALATDLKAFARRKGLRMDILKRAKPLWIPADSELVRKLLGVYAERTGKEAAPLSMGGGTYAKSLPGTVAFGPRFPDGADVAHKPDEYLDFDDYLRCLKIMGAAMVELAR